MRLRTRLLPLVPIFLLSSSIVRANDDAAELRYWLANMLRHDYSIEEIGAVTGLDETAITKHIAELAQPRTKDTPPSAHPKHLQVLPYPGGRHPRIGILEGALDPWRET